MALPTSPSVVVIENDQSVYVPNIESSIVGIVGFADKGPTNKATLITSQDNLINIFGRPKSEIPGQGLEGALEILETTNQVYFIRALNESSAANASAVVPLGFAPTVTIEPSATSFNESIITFTVKDNTSTFNISGTVTITCTSSTFESKLLEYFNKDIILDNPIYATKSTDNVLFLTSRFAGSGATLYVSGTNIGVKKVDPSGDGVGTVASFTTASGGTALSTGDKSLYALFESKYPGYGYNLSSLRDGSIVGLSVEIENRSIRDFIGVNSDGVSYESFILELSPSSKDSLTYILNTEDELNKSELINAKIQANATTSSTPNNIADKLTGQRSFSYNGAVNANSTPRFIKMLEGTYQFIDGHSGYSEGNEGDEGDNGTSGDIQALIGSESEKTGLYCLDDDSLNISIALIPGYPVQEVQNSLINLAETSKNFLALVSPPYGLAGTQQANDWMNGRVTRTSPISNSYAAVYWPWVQTFNFYAGGEEWYDPAIFAARQCAFTDSVAEPWFAPAGIRRGRLTKPTNVEFVLNQGDRDSLYSNNINPIIKEVPFGIALLGQKTAQRSPSALDRINVRRLMIYIRKVLLQLGKPFQFEPNDEFTWEQVESALDPFINELLARRAITEGVALCNSETNTPLRVDRNELWCSVIIKPTKAAETIVFEINLTNQSATINGQ